MRKALKLLTAIAISGIVAGCGGGGGGSVSLNSGTTTSGLTVESSTTRALSVTPSYLFTSGLNPKLVCNEGVIEPDEVSKTELHFPGNSFTNCTLTFTDDDGNVIFTSLDSITGKGGKVRLNDDLTLSPVAGEVQLSKLQDADHDGIADHCEHKKVTHHGLEDQSLYRKTVIVVLEGDNIPDQALTDYLKKNYDDLVQSLQLNAPADVKFVVIWDGGKEDGTDGNSDIFVLDPQSGKTFSVLDQDIQNVLNGDGVAQYRQDGIKFWFGASDNLSNHLKTLVEVATRMFPAQSYDLIVSDHGDGWVSLPTPTTRTVLYEWYDDGKVAGSTWLGTKQFADVLSQLKAEGIRFDLIGFDECLMGEFATLTLLKPYAEVFVVSPEYELGDGWGGVWSSLPVWYGQGLDSWSIAKSIVDGYVNYYKQNPPNAPLAYPQTIALTAVKSSAIDVLRESFESFAGDLKQTAENEVNNGQMYDVFYSNLSDNNSVSLTYFMTLWTDDDIYTIDENDAEFQTLVNATAYDGYHRYYGGSGAGYDSLGTDLLFMVTNTGAVARAYQLGYSANDVPTNYGTAAQPYAPEFAANTVQDALSFLDTYNQVRNNDELYTKYLYLDMQGGYDDNVTGSGISLVYPYTSPDYASVPKLNLCDYENFVETYNSTLPNYTGFVSTVFGELWKAVEDAGLYGNETGQFTCESGSAVWN